MDSRRSRSTGSVENGNGDCEPKKRFDAIAKDDQFHCVWGAIPVIDTEASGAIVEEDRTIKVYYGSADTSICMALGDLDELIERTYNGKKT